MSLHTIRTKKGRHAIQFGVYDPRCPPRFELLDQFAQRLGTPIQLISWYQAWGSCSTPCPSDHIAEAHRRGHIPMITWEPWRLPENLPPGLECHNQPDFSLRAVASGLYDGYIRSWARTLAAVKKSVYLRPMHEMNGNWYPWGGSVNGNSASAFVDAWRHLRHIFREEETHNVAWVWCPYARSVPEIPENSLEHYYPGDTEVDWLALDGYNWGSTQPWSSWESFPQVFRPAYERLIHLAPSTPIIIAEAGCAEDGGDKATWIAEAMESLFSDFTRVHALVWFNIDKECDWRIDSSPDSLRAFQKEAWRFQRSKRASGC